MMVWRRNAGNDGWSVTRVPLQRGKWLVQTLAIMLTQAINNVNSLQKTSGDLARVFDSGDQSVSSSDVMIARNKS